MTDTQKWKALVRNCIRGAIDRGKYANYYSACADAGVVYKILRPGAKSTYVRVTSYRALVTAFPELHGTMIAQGARCTQLTAYGKKQYAQLIAVDGRVSPATTAAVTSKSATPEASKSATTQWVELLRHHVTAALAARTYRCVDHLATAHDLRSLHGIMGGHITPGYESYTRLVKIFPLLTDTMVYHNRSRNRICAELTPNGAAMYATLNAKTTAPPTKEANNETSIDEQEMWDKIQAAEARGRLKAATTPIAVTSQEASTSSISAFLTLGALTARDKQLLDCLTQVNNSGISLPDLVIQLSRLNALNS